jgi:hypothetical protein
LKSNLQAQRYSRPRAHAPLELDALARDFDRAARAFLGTQRVINQNCLARDLARERKSI